MNLDFSYKSNTGSDGNWKHRLGIAPDKRSISGAKEDSEFTQWQWKSIVLWFWCCQGKVVHVFWWPIIYIGLGVYWMRITVVATVVQWVFQNSLFLTGIQISDNIARIGVCIQVKHHSAWIFGNSFSWDFCMSGWLVQFFCCVCFQVRFRNYYSFEKYRFRI